MKLAEVGNINPNKAYVREFKDDSQLELLYRYDKQVFHEEYYKGTRMDYIKIELSVFMFTINYSLDTDGNSIWYEFNTVKEAKDYINTKIMMEELIS